MKALRHILGLGAALAAGAAGYWLWTNWGQVARIDQWTGIEALRPWRPWLAVFRTVILVAGGILALSVLSWLWRRLDLGN
ncbi:MAG: hypothetical protein AAF713_00020 [Pseudomonadota bacterium]